jgi:hypothetical protein
MILFSTQKSRIRIMTWTWARIGAAAIAEVWARVWASGNRIWARAWTRII